MPLLDLKRNKRSLYSYFNDFENALSLFIGYLSWCALLKRREAFKLIVESKLWISGEMVFKSIEIALQEYDDSILRSETFTQFTTKLKHVVLFFSHT
jgi:hypothetical protein